MGKCNGTINWKKQLKLKASTRVQWESVMAQSTGNRRQQPTETSQVATGTGPAKYPVSSWVGSHCSLKSFEWINSTFNFMFPDSDKAKHFACGERKAAKLSTFAPYC